MKFRKKPVEIDAVQWRGENILEMAAHLQGSLAPAPHPKLVEWQPFEIKTLEGTMTVSLGDWVIRGVKGEYYPCKPDIFKATYDLVVALPPLVGDPSKVPPCHRDYPTPWPGLERAVKLDVGAQPPVFANLPSGTPL